MPEQVIVSYPKKLLSQPLWKSYSFVLSSHFPRHDVATQCFFSKLSLFVSLFLKLNFIYSYVSSGSLRMSSTRKFMMLGLLTFTIFNFLMTISLEVLFFEKKFSVFSKMIQATNSIFSISPSSLRRKSSLNCWCSVSRYMEIKIETVQ